ADSPIAQATAQRKPVQLTDLQEGTASPAQQAVWRAGYRALLVVPLIGPEGVVGALVVRRRTSGAFSPSTVDLLQTFAEHSVVAIQNARLFQQIQAKSQELDAASRHKSEFVANMSHELRTPLNAIIGYSEMLHEDAEERGADALAADLKKITVAGQHLLELINAVLDLSKIEAGKMELHIEAFDVAALVRDIAEVVQPLVEKNRNRLDVRADADVATMRGDLTKVRQALF